MENIAVVQLREDLLEETAFFIAGRQANDESFVAWLGYFSEEIKH